MNKKVFETKNIEEVTEILIDYRGKTPKKTASGVKLITAKVIKNGRINDGNHEFIAEENYDLWMRRGLPKQGDILITTEAPLGEVAQLKTPEKIALAQRVILLRGNQSLIDQSYYFQALKSPFVQAELNQRSTGTTVLGIKQSELRQVKIPFYPLTVQRKIAAILSNYDRLIENNTRRIKILEDMARSLYDEWFVKFRFPGYKQTKMLDSELGLIPEGWKVKKLGDIAAINRFNIKTSHAPEEINYIDIASVSTGIINKIESLAFADAPSRARRIVKHGDIIWSTVRPNRRSYSLILNPQPYLIVSTGFAVISPEEVPYTYLYQALTTDDFVGYLTNNATGSAYPAVNSGNFNNANILLPETQLLTKFSNIVEAILLKKQNLQRQNENLRKTRDLLLPKLISGEIDVENLDINKEELY